MKRFVLVGWIVCAVLATEAQTTKPNIVYVYDPLCSWCYTFDPVMDQLHDKYKGHVDFSVVSGGMIIGSRKKPVSFMEEYILAGYKDMENLTGIKFGDAYLALVKQGTDLLDSEKPSNAVVAYNALHSDRILEFVHELQSAYFLYGNSLNQDSTYLKMAQKFQLDGLSFLGQMKSDSIQKSTQDNFKKVEDSGISAFPTLLLRINGKVLPIVEGFEKFEKLDKKIAKLLKENK